jgi:hypothetical protein
VRRPIEPESRAVRSPSLAIRPVLYVLYSGLSESPKSDSYNLIILSRDSALLRSYHPPLRCYINFKYCCLILGLLQNHIQITKISWGRRNHCRLQLQDNMYQIYCKSALNSAIHHHTTTPMSRSITGKLLCSKH